MAATPLSSTNMLPVDLSGPTVNGRSTTASVFSISQLHAYPQVQYLPTLINDSFRNALVTRPFMGIPDPPPRLADVQAFFEQMEADPATFVLILAYSEERQALTSTDVKRSSTTGPGSTEIPILATATARRYLRTTPPVMQWQWPWPADPQTLEWELKLVAVHPSLQRQGIAGWVLNFMERAVVERSKKIGAAGYGLDHSGNDKVVAAGETKPIKMILTTWQQINEPWYSKRGYTLDSSRKPDQEANFDIADMSKILGEVRA